MKSKFAGPSSVLALAFAVACGSTSHNDKPTPDEGTPPAGAGASSTGSEANPTNAERCTISSFDPESGTVTCGTGAKQFRHRSKPGKGCSYDAKLVDTCDLRDCPGLQPFCDQQDGQVTCGVGCAVDTDCSEGQICECQGSGLGGRCKPSSCRTDAECSRGQWCSTLRPVCGDTAPFACDSPQDQCHVDADCPTGFCIAIPQAPKGMIRVCLGSLPCAP